METALDEIFIQFEMLYGKLYLLKHMQKGLLDI